MSLAHDQKRFIDGDLQSIQSVVSDFVARELMPLESRIERDGGLSADERNRVRAQAREIGLWCPSAPEELGGGGLSVFALTVINEELGAVISSLGAQSRLLGDDPCVPLVAVATDAQREEIFKPVFAGEKECAVAMTESDAGSDLRLIRTTAKKEADGSWRITGSKRWISGAKTADFILTLARTTDDEGNDGLSLFAVPTNAPGFTIGADEEVVGRRGITENELIYTDCIVSESAVLGGLNNGAATAGLMMTPVRLAVAAHSVGTIRRLLKMSREYALDRHTFGKPLADRQAIQWKLARMAANEVTIRAYVRRVAQIIDSGENALVEVALAKLVASQAAFEAADETMQIFGGLGYSSEMPIERIWRDTRLYRIVDGADEIITRMIARDVLAN